MSKIFDALQIAHGERLVAIQETTEETRNNNPLELWHKVKI